MIDDDERRAGAQARSPATPTSERKNVWRTASGSARAWSASARSRRSASCSPTCPATTSRSAPAWARRRRCNIVVLPVLFEGEVKAVIELASFHRFSEIHLAFLDQLTESIGIVLNTIAANMRTEELLKQSQSLTEELQSQQEELTETNNAGAQAASLQQSEELLKQQQDELQQHQRGAGGEGAAARRAERARSSSKNREVEQARRRSRRRPSSSR